MSFVNAIINAVDTIAWRVLSASKGTVNDYCDLDSIINPHTFITKKCELISYIEIEGCLSLSGEQEFIEACERLELLFNGLLEKPHHSLQWVFARSPSQTENLLEQKIAPLKTSARNLNLHTDIIDYLLDERKQTLKRFIIEERCILAFKTHLQALTKTDRKEQQTVNKHSELNGPLKEAGIPLKFGDFSQPHNFNTERLDIIHQAGLKTLVDKLNSKEIGLVAKVKEVHSAIKEIRQMISPDMTSDKWRPSLPGDPIPYRDQSLTPGGRDNEYFPLIAQQIFKQSVTQIKNIVQVGEDFWTSVTMELPPQVPERFDRLFSLLPTHINWRFSLTILGGDDFYAAKIKSRHAWAKVFKPTNASHNDSIVDATQYLADIRREGEKLSGIRINLSIRANSKERALREINICARLLQSWGNIDTQFEHGDPWGTVVSSLPGLDNKQTGKTIISPLKESTILCPITRPVSPWQEEASTNLWRTIDGKIYPYQPCSSLQHTWVTLIYASPGGGKSVSLNSQNLNLILTPGLSRLPRISILDVGPSSQGMIELVKSTLPASRQHEALYKTLKNDKHSAINPFDTPLGFRFPNTSKREFLINFLLILFTENGQDTIKPGLGELVPDLIEAVYRYYSDEKNPKAYTPKVEPLIDSLIEKHPDWFVIQNDTQRRSKLTWWKIVDVLAEHEYWDEASISQRNAVPLLGDLTSVLHANQQLKDTHGVTQKDEEVFSHLNKMIRSSITQFPILSYPTQFNTQQARVRSLDLADVVGGSDKYALKRAGLMYMLGILICAGDYYFSEEDLKGHDKPSRKYHEQRLNRELSEIKRICFDEFHRTRKLPAIRNQVVQYMREARKFKVEIVLLSQIDTDFDDDMLELATSIFIFRGSEGKALDRVCKIFDLNESARHALKYQVHGASAEGASFMLKCRTKTGSFVQVLVNTMGPTELWALASTAEDSLLRRQLAQKMSYLTAVKLLAKEFPTGSCKKEVDAIISEKNLSMEDVIEMIVNKLVKQID